MVLKAEGKFTLTKQGKVLLYFPKSLTEDSQWPFKDYTKRVEITVFPEERSIIITQLSEGKPRG